MGQQRLARRTKNKTLQKCFTTFSLSTALAFLFFVLACFKFFCSQFPTCFLLLLEKGTTFLTSFTTFVCKVISLCTSEAVSTADDVVVVGFL